MLLLLKSVVFPDKNTDDPSSTTSARILFSHNAWAFPLGVGTAVRSRSRDRSAARRCRRPVSTAAGRRSSDSRRPGREAIRASSDDDDSGVGGGNNNNKIRLNKVFKSTHSRREADRLIEEGRVSVNGERVATKGGFFVVPYEDEISLDGRIVEGWEEMNYFVADGGTGDKSKNDSGGGSRSSSSSIAINDAQAERETNGKGKQRHEQRRDNTPDGASTRRAKRHAFEYIKYWKPRGVICTTDPSVPGNIIDEIRTHDGYDPPHRVYPVGRLDKDTTGLILITSDGRLPNAALRKEHKRPKTYEVRVDPPLGPPGSPEAERTLRRLREGVVISTETVRNGVRQTLTAPTEPCGVEQLDDRWISITLREGRNRQVRKMTQAVGHRTVVLERVSFAGIPLEPGLRGPGDWDYLNREELDIVRDMIRVAAEARRREADGGDAELSERD